jgi:hypothetical protein
MPGCQECYIHSRYGCGGQGSWADDHKKPCWKANYEDLERENVELKHKLETHKEALKLIAKVKLAERIEQVCEDEVEREVIWFLGMAEHVKVRKEIQDGKEL